MKTILRRLAVVLTITRVSVLVAVGGMFLFSNVANAATYNFTQSSYAGGATAATAVHPTNATGWTQYSSASTTVSASVGGVSLNSQESVKMIKFGSSQNNKVKMMSATNAFVASDSSLYNTTDSGATFSQLKFPGNTNAYAINGIAVLDAQNMYASSYLHLYKTTNGGSTWTDVRPGYNYQPGLIFVNATTGWALQYAGGYQLIKTADGGNTWSTQISTSTAINDIQFIDINNGWAVGANGTALKTTDGGTTWTQTNLGTTYAVNKVKFISTTTGWVESADAAGWGRVIQKTTDGGTTWATQTPAIGLNISDLYATDTNTIWFIGSSNYNSFMYKSSDGGTTWTQQLNLPYTYLFNSISGIDANTVMVTGGRGTIMVTTNGGTAWNYTQGNIIAGNTEDRLFTTSSFLFLGGYKSTDGGASWVSAGSPQESVPDYTGYSFVSATTGWGIGSNTIIYKTTDGGVTWVAQTTPITVYMKSVSFADINNGWIGGTSGNILHTSDGGATWVQQGAGMTTNNINKIIALSSTNALLFDSGGYVRRTTDGGVTWTSTVVSTNESLWNASFVDANNGWIAAGSGNNIVGHIYKTTDGGITWASSYASTYPINDILFTDANNGYALVDFRNGADTYNSPILLITRDGGATWMDKRSVAPNNFVYNKISNSWSCGDLGFNGFGVYFGCSYMIGSNNQISHVFKISTSYPTGGYLISSPYNSGSAANILSKITWTGSTPTGTNIQFQVRTAPDSAGSPGVWTAWMGPDGTSATYFTDSTGVTQAIPAALKDGVNDQWIQYQVTLTSNGTVAPSVGSVTMQYVVNATPQFDATYGTNGVTVSQVATSADPNWGKVAISYSVRDPDTTTGNVTPGFVTPSFEYSTNSGTSWTVIPASDLLASDITNKAVNGTTYTIYSATWSATSTIPSLYNPTMEVRVTVNDNEAANNIAKAASGLFTLDTKTPVVSFGIDSSVASSTTQITMTATDNSQLQYRLCNDSTFPVTDTKGNSCAWSTLGGNIASSTITWTPSAAATAPATETVYLQVRDALGNITNQTIIAPAIPTNFDYKDISNIGIGVYREFLSWALFQNSTGSTFGGYNLYTSTDGTNYSLLSNITNLQTNFYVDNITTATSSMHYYKVSAYDTLGNKSHYTPVLSDIPNGTGGTDVTPPTITNVAVPAGNIKNTSAQVTFTTDKLTQATVQYRVNGTTPWSTYSNISYLKDQSVYITGLVPNTLYNIQVKAVDVYGNMSATVAGPDFTTSGGPVITNVTVSSLTDISATIFWNTSTSSDSYVYYSQFATMVSPGTAGSAVLVPCVASLCQHQVTISGLTAGKQYYYYVKSTDGLGNMSTDTNTNNYYNFITTLDTTPPVITGISTPVMAAKQAVVVWKTDEPSTSQVLYSTTSGDTSKYTITDLTKSIYHVVTLSAQTTNAGAAGGTNELIPETKYYYVVKSADTAGNTATSPEQTFTTPNTGDVTIVAVSIVNTSLTGAGATPDTTPPIISDIKATPIDSFNEAISFTTNKDAVTFIDYGKDTTYGNNVGHPVLTTSHNTKLPGLSMGTNYHYRVTVIDKSGNMTKSDDQTFKTPFLSEQVATSTAPLDDNTLLQTKIEDLVQSALPSLSAPYITVPKITNISEHGATVSWNTNVKAYGLLGYASDDDYIAKNSSYSAELSAGSNRTVAHSVDLTNLKSNTKYHIQASSYVFQQVVGKSDDITFLTKPAQIQGSVAERTKSSFTVVWTTDEPATSIVEYIDKNTGATGRTSDETMRTAHSVKIENLPSGSTYTVNISGINKEGNTLEAVSPLTITVPRDLIPPVISGFKVDNALVPGRTDRIQTIVSWKTDKPADSTVYYEEGAGTPGETAELANKVTQTGTFVQSHSIILPNLKPGTIYRLKITSIDDSGNKTSFGPRTIITPQQTQSITDVIFKNFEDSFKFLRAF